ncbi:Crp/Fnr family transcriptional regulator [Chelatococcus sp. GCM10030263]|uniref:Crp/Fnr family transcriptional regulator n=1 Tax=Chelatococcus sp. GCM10030263 TaxID=3273387 RepID=UPI003611CB3F
MTNPFLLNLERRDRLSDAERSIVEAMSRRQRRVAANRDIVREGDRPTESCLVLSGFSARYNVLGDGRRQITAIHIPGEFIDLHSLLLARLDHSVVALTDCMIATVPHEYLKELTQTEPHFTRMLWLLTVTDAAVFRQWLVASGRLTSVGQIAHFLCELFVRLQVIGMTEGFNFRLPISQAELSDAMGLSVVHVNRTIQELRRRGLIIWEGEEIRILDWVSLQRVGEFDPTYLNLENEPR